MANKALKVVTITIGGVVYTAKATIGMYAKACDIAGLDVSALFQGVLPQSRLVTAFAQVVSGLSEQEISDTMAMSEYPDAVAAIMGGIVGSDVNDDCNNANTNASQSSQDDAPKN